MKTFGMRQAKAHLSEMARDAAKGECSLITYKRKPVAMVGPAPSNAHAPATTPPGEGPNVTSLPSLVAEETPMSDAAAFRKALLGPPFPLELDF